jgi:ATP-dependent helicase/nuclease subunit B
VTLHRLAERLGAAALAGAQRRPVSAPVIAAAIGAVLDEAPGVFAPVADHPATDQALVAAYRELRAVPDAALDALAECSARASDVVRIHRAGEERLVGAWHDEEDLLAAAGALRSGATSEIGPVVVHLLPDLTTGGADLVQALAARGALLVNQAVTNYGRQARAAAAEASWSIVDTPTISAKRRAMRAAAKASDAGSWCWSRGIPKCAHTVLSL